MTFWSTTQKIKEAQRILNAPGNLADDKRHWLNKAHCCANR